MRGPEECMMRGCERDPVAIVPTVNPDSNWFKDIPESSLEAVGVPTTPGRYRFRGTDWAPGEPVALRYCERHRHFAPEGMRRSV